MNNLVSRSLQILGNTVVDIGKDYTSNLTSLVTDAQNVKNSLIRTSTDASDTYAKLKNTNITKKISDWFYDRENESDASMSGDEFDAGFKVDSSDDHPLDGETKARVLDFASMTDISEKQTAAMYKVGRRQTEQTVANTAEIVSTINTRTSEMIASMNNINKTLMGINDNLNKLVQASVVTGDNSPTAVDKGGLFSDGKLTLTGILEASKQALSSNSLVSFGQSFLSAMQQGALTPETLLKEALSMTVLNKPMVGGKSINDIGKSFNDAIGTAIQTGFSEILGSKFFKDVVKIESDKDYSTLVKSSYDTKKAQFDGMTRMSIVSVIPEYLNKINESLSGRSYHVDNMGKLVEGPRPNKFAAVAENLSTNSGLTNKVFGKIEQAMQTVMPGKQINSDDIDFAARALAMTIVWNMHYTGQRVFNVSDLKKDLSPYMTTAGAVCATSGKNSDPKYWGMIMQTIVMQLSSGLMDASKFAQNVNQMLQNTIQAASDFAQSSSPDANQAGKITYDMAVQALYKSAGIKSTTTTSTPTPAGSNANNNNGKSTVSDGKLGRADKNDPTLASTNEYLRGIFGILNRGIDVKVTNKRNSTKGYGDYKLSRTTTTKEVVDEKFGSLMMAQLTGSGKADDESTLKNLIHSGMEDAKNTLLGQAGAEAFDNARNSQGGFFVNFMSNLGASGVRELMSRALNGTLKNDVKQFFGKDGKFRETTNAVKNKVVSTKNETLESLYDAHPELLYDRRYRDTKDAIVGEDGVVYKATGAAKDVWGKISDKANGSKLVNNIRNKVNDFRNTRQYNLDTVAMNRAKEDLSFTSGKAGSFDDLHVDLVRQMIEYGEYDDALQESRFISDSRLQKLVESKVNKIRDIQNKRKEGETKLANGETPDVGAVLPANDSPLSSTDTKKNPILGAIKTGFSMVGKFYKQMAKLEARGATNVYYGFKNMMEGFVGGRQRDAKGNIVRDENGKAVWEDGLLQLGFTKPAKFLYGKAFDGTKKLVNRVWNGKQVDKWATDSDGYVLRDENGDPITERTNVGGLKSGIDRFWNGKKDGEGNRITPGFKGMQVYSKNDATVADLLKEPTKTLKSVMSSMGTEFKKLVKQIPLVGKAAETAYKKTKQWGSEIGDKIKNSKLGQAWSKREPSKIGNFLKNNAFAKGFTKGFKGAAKPKEAADDNIERLSSFPNKALGNIMDAIMGKSGEKSAFTALCESIQGVRDDMNKNHEETIKKDDEKDKKQQNQTDNNKPTVETGSTTGGGSVAADVVKTANGGASTQSAASASSTEVSGAVASADSGWEVSSGSKAASAVSSVAGSAGKAGGGILGFLKSALGSIGKIMGGFGQMLGGILQMVIATVASLDGISALMSVFTDIIPNIVKPLNGIFTSLIKAIQPTIDAFTGIFSAIAEAITIIVTTLVDLISPILDAFEEIFNQIFAVLAPILDTIIALANCVFVPLMIAMNVITPVIQGIGYTLQIVSGIVQVGLGYVISLLGKVVQAVGHISEFLGGDDSVTKAGETMAKQGQSMVDSGKSQVTTGWTGLKDVAAQLIPGDQEWSDADNKDKSSSSDGSENVNINGGAMGSGDVINNSYVYNNTYGSGNKNIMNQHTYGNYMNMSERGCGPVALADAYSRRTGISMSPVSLASNMAGSGAYEPNRGTSVGSLVRTGNALGMNMHVGGVTQSSLKRATPSNPITLLGSGSDYGTRKGNDHYVNVIGTDRNGGAYVSNPMTGRVERRSTSTLAQNARLGLYGSGDSDGSEFFSFDEDTTNAFTKLKNLTSKLTGMFTGDSTSDKMKKTIGDYDNAYKAKRIKNAYSSEEDYEAALADVYDKFRSDYPKHANETDEEYETRLESLWKNDKIKNKYIVRYMGQEAANLLSSSYDTSMSKMNTLYEGMTNALTQSFGGTNSSGGSGVMSSIDGVDLYNFGEITHKTTNITSETSDESPLHDFFSATAGDHAYSTNGHWFRKRNKPDSTGTGTFGEPTHGGVDFLWNNAAGEDVSDGKEIHATTDGVVTKSTPETGTGNMIRWKDKAGWYHWYMHMVDSPLKQTGENVKAGDLLGYVGTSGDSTGPHLHYTIRNTEAGRSADENSINPLTYFNVYRNNDELNGDTNEEKIWAYMIRNGATPIGAAGFMGAWQAESGNDPDTLEGYYYWNNGKKSTEVQNAFASTEGMDDYVVNKLFPRYDRDGVSYYRAGYQHGEHYYPGVGLAQWTGGRTMDLANTADSLGKQWNDLGLQMAFWKKDVTGPYSDVFASANAATTTDESTRIVLNKYEGNPNNKLSERQQYAQSFYDRFKDYNPDKVNTDSEFPSGLQHPNSQGDVNMRKNVTEIGTTNGKNTGTVVTQNDPLTLRQGPGTDTTALDKIPNGQKLDLVYDSTCKSGWYKTSYNGKTGYVSADYINLDYKWQDYETSTGSKSQTSTVSGYQYFEKASIADTVQNATIARDTTSSISSSIGSTINNTIGNALKNSIKRPTTGTTNPNTVTNTTTTTTARVCPYTEYADEWHGPFYTAQNGVYDELNMLVQMSNAVKGVDSGLPTTYTEWRSNFSDYSQNKSKYGYGFVPKLYSLHQLYYPGSKFTLTDAYSKPDTKITKIDSNYSGILSTKGSGDIAPDNSFWYDALINNSSQVSQDIPPLDESKFMDSDSLMSTYGNVINKYEIKSENIGTDEFLEKMSKLTFNVRAQRVEELLEELIEKIDGGDKPSSPKPSTPTNTNLFTNNSIPEQVTRLSRG